MLSLVTCTRSVSTVNLSTSIVDGLQWVIRMGNDGWMWCWQVMICRKLPVFMVSRRGQRVTNTCYIVIGMNSGMMEVAGADLRWIGWVDLAI